MSLVHFCYYFVSMGLFFFFQAEDGIRDFCLSRGLGDVYKRQILNGFNTAQLLLLKHFWRKRLQRYILLLKPPNQFALFLKQFLSANWPCLIRNRYKDIPLLITLSSFVKPHVLCVCLLYTSDAADEEDSVDLVGRLFVKKKI
eukprot:TRINITY_DN51844_c0_g1_i1.p1 TRINITY_DN51844_c0_g1~~TRINITY_DN51844_c0_g1_i1.p1  ORF type:complete len:143 (-),score=2.40 TRINITY_DN51844_c0_g1_i1:41-469(-)